MANLPKKETFTFEYLPHNVAELQAFKEAEMTSPFMSAALSILALCEYENNPEESINMLDFLKGPQPLSTYDKQFLRDRLVQKGYVPRSFLAGTSPQNDYTPSQPYTVTIEDNPYSYINDGYAVMHFKSSGADSLRQLTMRRKGDKWYLYNISCLSDIRQPQSQDPWA